MCHNGSMKNLFAALLVSLPLAAAAAKTAPLKPGDAAPAFSSSLDDGTAFELSSRAGKWTVLYFYPKADTPGCTKQACAFRDSIAAIRALGAEVVGVSMNSASEQAAFKKKHRLNFPLVADEKGEIARLYGAKMPMLPMSKRWTFILDPELKIRRVDRDVDPAADAARVAEALKALQAAK